MKNAVDETLNSALSFYSSFPFSFDDIEFEQHPHEKLCIHDRLLHRNFHPSILKKKSKARTCFPANTQSFIPLFIQNKVCSSYKLTMSDLPCDSLNCSNSLFYLSVPCSMAVHLDLTVTWSISSTQSLKALREPIKRSKRSMNPKI